MWNWNKSEIQYMFPMDDWPQPAILRMHSKIRLFGSNRKIKRYKKLKLISEKALTQQRMLQA